jgi:hypothetical protein
MSGFFQNIQNIVPPPLTASVYPPPLVRGEDLLARGRVGGGVKIFWKTPDTALYSTSVNTLCWIPSKCIIRLTEREPK